MSVSLTDASEVLEMSRDSEKTGFVNDKVALTAQDHSDEVKSSQDIRTSTAVVKPIVYISPRLDQEYYQAEINDISCLAAPTFEAARGKHSFSLQFLQIPVTYVAITSNL
jgi:hypothetical protein